MLNTSKELVTPATLDSSEVTKTLGKIVIHNRTEDILQKTTWFTSSGQVNEVHFPNRMTSANDLTNDFLFYPSKTYRSFGLWFLAHMYPCHG